MVGGGGEGDRNAREGAFLSGRGGTFSGIVIVERRGGSGSEKTVAVVEDRRLAHAILQGLVQEARLGADGWRVWAGRRVMRVGLVAILNGDGVRERGEGSKKETRTERGRLTSGGRMARRDQAYYRWPR